MAYCDDPAVCGITCICMVWLIGATGWAWFCVREWAELVRLTMCDTGAMFMCPLLFSRLISLYMFLILDTTEFWFLPGEN